ncbi:AMP-binding protein [Massilia antarctica]|uniref:AMP-binding protein n=1 Tax=Massilia antarctica TaxID=2765360 RepID=UPI0006BB80E8|nr:AMP-binding protein [Massilia sp. H27-R4]MCY0912513.1 AMP-binding protein [Massilia sp. H27-R4]CUI03560.1 FIGfam138462: Acyl-CoA synthetase, AMP-(fatty) acid ligase / (3R)-hydroxymyristoyl-[ACP] dehydratase [Janthinobacterium sp. CG23_2]CUU27346.1 FIGfam138462: Acyl-CoA synthetase, AMP-(fatty) acid ligase / (3R)-hydroxymyristoyl-[ACP] dehydratase [Janthinobacterium sp. CG23_2]
MADLFSILGTRDGAAIAGWREAASVRTPVTVAALRARAGAWRALALRTPGTNAALYIEDSLEFAAALLGAWQAGKTVWLSADTLEASCIALARSVDCFLGEFPARWTPLQPAHDDACALPWSGPDGDFAALVVHTSGSTGAPQAIPKQLSQLTSEVATLDALFGPAIGDADVYSTVSHQHIYGLLFKVLWPLAAGRAIHAASLAYPEQLAQVLGQRACVLVASPAHLKRLPAHLDWSAAASCLRAVFSSGGPLAPDASVAAAHLLGQVPIEIYGSSETGGVAWRRHHPGLPGAWEALPGVAWRIAPDSGRLEVRSSHLGDDGWLALDDRVNPAPDGRFLLLGRSDRLVKIEEKRISLDAIEAALVASGLASEARVIVCPERAGERQVLAGFVIPSASGRALLDAEGKQALNALLRAHLGRVVEAVALPRRWRYLDQFPLNAQGKTTHAQLLALLGVGDARPRVPQVRLLEQDAQHTLLEMVVPSTLFYFDGHFTQAAVLPGVVQVDWAIRYARLHFAMAPAFRAIHALKFQQVVRPDIPFQLELKYDRADDGASGTLHFRYFSDAGQHAGGRILFGP